jgi:hypothetical protein
MCSDIKQVIVIPNYDSAFPSVAIHANRVEIFIVRVHILDPE